LANSINIPYKEVKKRAKELDPNVEYRTVCALGKTSYFAARDLMQAGIKTSCLVGGLKLHDKPKPEAPVEEPVAPAATAVASAVAGATDSALKHLIEPERVVSLDCSGMACPGPLLKLRGAVKELPPNATLHVMATDPGFKADVKAFAASNGFKVSGLRTEKGVIHANLVRDGVHAVTHLAADKSEAASTIAGAAGSVVAANADRKGATIVVFSQEYDKVLGAFVIANGAAAMGGDVTMFFTFWGLNALRDSNRRSSEPKKFMDKMFGMMMPKGVPNLPLSNMNFGGMGPVLLKKEMANKNLPNLPKLVEAAKAQGIRLVACTMSMEAMGIQSSELIDGVEYGGVAEYLGAAQKAGTNLFI
jgi:peroxiredoxin family protein/TusA-related sulfurtransferase